MDATADLWIDATVDAGITPSVETRPQILPFDQLSWQNFERLCYRLAWRRGDVSDCRRYGVQGQSQQGIDIYFRDAKKESYGAWQCKRHAGFSAQDIKDAVSLFLKNPWAKKSKFFSLAVTVDLSPTDLADEVVKQTNRCLGKGISFEPLDQDRLSLLLKDYPDLVDDFFGRGWATLFCGVEACEVLDGRKLSREQRIEARKKLGDLYAIHFATIDGGLPAAAGLLGGGDKPLPLHERYVFPKAETVTTVTQASVDPVRRTEPGIKDGFITPPVPKSGVEGAFVGFITVEHRTKVDLFDWLSTTERAVVIAEPGLGKSATLRFIVLDLLRSQPRSEALARNWGNYLPLLIPFAVITRFVNEGEVGGILEYVKRWLREINASDVMLNLFDIALTDERILLLVDGLDEWSDATTAHTAMTKLVTFAQSRKLPVIATSRPIGHQRISGFLPTWKRADLLHFDAEQQRTFTLAWYKHFLAISQSSADAAAIANMSARQADSFMDEIKQDPALFDLASVPLLLSALISLRLRGQVLPRSRYEALDAICKTLIQEQPQKRAQAALKSRGSLQLHSGMVEQGIQFLAHFILSSPTSTTVGREEAKTALSEFYSKEFRKKDEDAFEIAGAQVDFAANEIGILVEAESGKIAFLHRSLQEFLAAKNLKRLPFNEVKRFVIENLTRATWQEPILALFASTERKDEIDDILAAIQATELSPLHSHGVMLFLARVAFRDFNCSAEVAKEVAKEIFSIIERSPWMPIREALIREVVRGLDSEILREDVCQFLKKSFPRRVRWRTEIIGHLGKHPTQQNAALLLRALLNSDRGHEMREIANALAKCASACPEIAHDLRTVITSAGETDLVGSALHALAEGWPSSPELPKFLEQAAASTAENLKCIGLIHIARRGKRDPDIKSQLSHFCNGRSRVYPWEDDVLGTLKGCWLKDPELKRIALDSVQNRLMPTEWHDHVALKYLVETFPQDQEVAELIAEIMQEAKSISTEFDHSVNWDTLIANFGGHPIVVPHAEEILSKHIDETWNDFGVSQLARLAGTGRARALIFERFRKGIMQARWFIITILGMNGGQWDAELKEILAAFSQDRNNAGTVADCLPQLGNPERTKAQLLGILEDGKGTEIGFVFSGLAQLGALESPEAVEIIKRRLNEDKDGQFWYFAKYALLDKFRDFPEVRAAALSTLDKPGYDTFTLIDNYGEDQEFRPLFESLLSPLSKTLRLALIQELHRFGLRNDTFALELLQEYARESDPEVKTAASRRYYTAKKKFSSDLAPLVERLKVEMNTVGMDFDFHRQAAITGLLALGHPEGLSDESLKREGGSLPTFSIHAEGDVNWEFVRALVESWDSMVSASGPQVWKRFHSSDVIVRELFRAGRRQSAVEVLSENLEEIRRQAPIDPDSFTALSLLEGHQPAFKELCIRLINRLVREDGDHSGMSWTRNDIEVQIEAGRFLAKNYAGDPDLAKILVHAASHSVERTAAFVALCSGWPNEPFLSGVWDAIKDQELNDSPEPAWLTALFASPKKFAEYVARLPLSFQREAFWRYPRESVQAVRSRLTKDTQAREQVLALLKKSDNGDILASTYRLLGLTEEEKPALSEWGASKIKALRSTSEGCIQPMGFDMMKGQVRPIEFSILEACLTK